MRLRPALRVVLCVLVFAAAGARTARAQVAEGERLLALDRLEAARDAFERALADAPVAARVGLARVALAAGEPRDAEAHAAEALARDPDDLAALLVRAVAYRDLARHRTALQRWHWRGAEEHFEKVLARDSAYADVLAEYALLRTYADRWDDALALAHAAVRETPESAFAHRTLLRTYRRFLHHAGAEAVAARLAEPDTPYAALFAADAARRAGRLRDAARLLAGLDTSGTVLPRTAVLVARGRLALAGGDEEAAHGFFERAVEAVDGAPASAVLFEDAAFLFTGADGARYRTLTAPDDLRAFWRAFWAARDPMPARAVNVRLVEHYRRLAVAERDYGFFGLRSFFNRPGEAAALDLPPTFALGEGFNDQGRVFLRHGAPDDRITALGADLGRNMSWRYYGAPSFDVHFAVGEHGIGDNWRLTAVPPGVGARGEWGGVYARLANPSSPLERMADLADLREASRAHTRRALTTERHRWPDDVVPIDVPYVVAAFRGEGGATRLEVLYRQPAAALREALPGSAPEIAFEVGAALHNRAWRPVDEARRTERVALAGGGDVGAFVFTVPPDSYRVALHGRVPSVPNVLGGHEEWVEAYSFRGAELAMSDLLPAVHAGPAEDGAGDRGAVDVRPAPEATFAADGGVFVYFEVYGLRTVDGATDAEVTYTLAPEGGRRRFFGLFGRDDGPVLTLRTAYRGADPDPQEWAELDVSRVRRGDYTLTVAVTDRHAGATVRRARRLTLVD